MSSLRQIEANRRNARVSDSGIGFVQSTLPGTTGPGSDREPTNLNFRDGKL
jgi:hypothetical protein